MKSPLERLASRREGTGGESGASFTIEFLIYVPLAVAFIGFMLNSAFHWTTYFYMQSVVNDAASYTAIAGGNVIIPYVPTGGPEASFNLKPTEYIYRQAATNPFVTKMSQVRCGMMDGRTQVNGVAMCVITYNTLVFPTDPLTSRWFGQDMTVVAEDLSQTAYNPNLS